MPPPTAGHQCSRLFHRSPPCRRQGRRRRAHPGPAVIPGWTAPLQPLPPSPADLSLRQDAWAHQDAALHHPPLLQDGAWSLGDHACPELAEDGQLQAAALSPCCAAAEAFSWGIVGHCETTPKRARGPSIERPGLGTNVHSVSEGRDIVRVGLGIPVLEWVWPGPGVAAPGRSGSTAR